jgi:hypothetical protein
MCGNRGDEEDDEKYGYREWKDGDHIHGECRNCTFAWKFALKIWNGTPFSGVEYEKG